MITSPTDLSQQHPCLKLYTSHYQGVFGTFTRWVAPMLGAQEKAHLEMCR